MELIYTTRRSDFDPRKHYRNPEYFERVDRRADAVVIEGDYPNIKKAYEAAKVKVTVAGEDESDTKAEPKSKTPKSKPSSKE